MSAVPGLDVEQLLQPISSSAPCGGPLQYDPAYDQIRRLRQSQHSDLPTGVWERQAPQKLEWSAVYGQCVDFLVQRSKDLQVAAWLVESLVRQHGRAGLASGLHFFVSLLVTYWDDVHPQLEAADATLRLTPVNWLLRELMRWHHGAVLASDASGPADPGAKEAQAEWASIEADVLRLEEFLAIKVGDQAPHVGEFLAVIRAQHKPSVPAPRQAQAVAEAPVHARRVALSPSMSRDEAYDNLHEIAMVLQRLEPHSPVPGVLLGLVSWRNARFEDLLASLPQSGPSVYELVKLFKAEAAA